MTQIATVTSELEVRLVVPGGPALPVVAVLCYAANDPWAVRVGFHTGGEDDGIVEWMFARQLLTDGVEGAIGEGDVRVWPSLHDGARLVNLAVDSPSGAALFEIDRNLLVEFLQRTYLAVPTGSEGEVVDLEAELALLLGDRPV